MQQIAVSELSAEGFARFGMIGLLLPDGSPGGAQGAGEVALDLGLAP